ncbi:BES1/BZR1 homolog protein 4-like [Impatiens glandulifera]|uniref:BES1/BZR1 homolog protein 4-like n=1 Tax=Impatiens glandulifera TaxID=253017 RepID=UPI001FB1489C|nr:BES1/BZR1 homolog protein 4-like [Impatiens glandulifera]XP_047335083.1 BES1/BZR1 homolog protein 4-like [Impatiens glandulifera]XP_047335085.1 BES1/BZR1 homolog protein 4-like [Impatiens glandulifera]
MASGSRTPSWKERENNKKRERRRRALAAKIFAGLRMYGNYKLPKHCDNNEVLKALCNEAGWTVESDGTTYRQGCKPPPDRMDFIGGSISATASPCSSSYHPSPCASYNPSPTSSSFPSPSSSTHSYAAHNPNGTSLIPWLKNLPSASSTKFPHPYIHGGSISAPVTPPLSSPRMNTNWDGGHRHHDHDHKSMLFPSSTPPSPAAGRQSTVPGLDWPPNSPTFSFVSFNPFGFKDNRTTITTNGSGGSSMWTPGQSGTCSPVIPVGVENNGGHVRDAVMSEEFAFGCTTADGLVKPWEGERIHEEFGSDDLELTLGCSKTRLVD